MDLEFGSEYDEFTKEVESFCKENNKASGRALFVMDAENSDKIILSTKAGVLF